MRLRDLTLYLLPRSLRQIVLINRRLALVKASCRAFLRDRSAFVIITTSLYSQPDRPQRIRKGPRSPCSTSISTRRCPRNSTCRSNDAPAAAGERKPTTAPHAPQCHARVNDIQFTRREREINSSVAESQPPHRNLRVIIETIWRAITKNVRHFLLSH